MSEGTLGTSGTDAFFEGLICDEGDGWETAYEFSWDDDGGVIPSSADASAYLAAYERALAKIGLAPGRGRSMHSADASDDYLADLIDLPLLRARSLFARADGGSVTELCGALTVRYNGDDGIGVELRVFDETGLLGGWR